MRHSYLPAWCSDVTSRSPLIGQAYRLIGERAAPSISFKNSAAAKVMRSGRMSGLGTTSLYPDSCAVHEAGGQDAAGDRERDVLAVALQGEAHFVLALELEEHLHRVRGYQERALGRGSRLDLLEVEAEAIAADRGAAGEIEEQAGERVAQLVLGHSHDDAARGLFQIADLDDVIEAGRELGELFGVQGVDAAAAVHAHRPGTIAAR